MTLRPGALLGLPEGFPHLQADAIVFRYALLLLAALWALMLSRGRARSALVAGVLFVEVALAFRVLALGRPYGLLIDTGITEWIAGIAVAAASPGSGILVGLAPPDSLSARLAEAGLSPLLLASVPTLLPLLLLPALAGLLFGLTADRDKACIAATLLLAFPTSEAEAVRGYGFVPGLWARPAPAVVVAAATALALLLGRVAPRSRLAGVAGAVGIALAALGAARAAPGGGGFNVPDLLLDPGPLAWLGLWGLRGGAAPASRALAAGGAAGLLICRLQSADPWTALALYRLGLVAASARTLAESAAWLTRRLPAAPGATQPEALRARVGALLLLLLLPGSFLARWDPGKLDPTAQASLESLHTSLQPAASWIRSNTEPGSSLAVSPDYAADILVMSGRPLLRAPGAVTPRDEPLRLAREAALLEGRPGRRLRDRYPVTHLVDIRGDRKWPADVDRGAVPGLELRYADRLVRIYRVTW